MDGLIIQDDHLDFQTFDLHNTYTQGMLIIHYFFAHDPELPYWFFKNIALEYFYHRLTGRTQSQGYISIPLCTSQPPA